MKQNPVSQFSVNTEILSKEKTKVKKTSREIKEKKAKIMLCPCTIVVLWYLTACHAPLVKSIESGIWPSHLFTIQTASILGLAWAWCAGWEKVSSAKGSSQSWGEYNNVDGEDPWLIMVKEGRSCSFGQRRGGLERRSPTHGGPWPGGALGGTQNYRGEQWRIMVSLVHVAFLTWGNSVSHWLDLWDSILITEL